MKDVPLLDPDTLTRVFAVVVATDAEPERSSDVLVPCPWHHGVFRFPAARLAAWRDDVAAALARLDDQVRAPDGASLDDLCRDRWGRRWGEELDAVALGALAIGCGLAQTVEGYPALTRIRARAA